MKKDNPGNLQKFCKFSLIKLIATKYQNIALFNLYVSYLLQKLAKNQRNTTFYDKT
jgi:hypothetical protein